MPGDGNELVFISTGVWISEHKTHYDKEAGIELFGVGLWGIRYDGEADGSG